MMAVAVRIKSQPKVLLISAILLLLVLLQAGQCSDISSSSEELEETFESAESDESTEIITKIDYSNSSCEAIYQDYLQVLANFTHCELKYASPFRLCISCTDQFALAKAMYTNLTQEPKHAYCKIKYMQSDRVQVIPTMQANIEDIWNKAHCSNCYSYAPNGLEAANVKCRPDVAKFLKLYENFTVCINSTVEDDMDYVWSKDANSSVKCKNCSKSYSLLNEHYNTMYNNDSGDLCMDIMDRMNYTRMLWSLHLKCTSRNGDQDSLPVVIVSCVVACTPILFYVSLKVTGKVGRKTIFKQKRLGRQQGSSGESQAAASGDQLATRYSYNAIN